MTIAITFALFVLCQLAWLAAQASLIQSLRDFHPEAHRDAGSPSTSMLPWVQSFNSVWFVHVMGGRFRRSPHTPASLMTTYRIAQGLGWAALLSFVRLIVALMPIVVRMAHGGST